MLFSSGVAATNRTPIRRMVALPTREVSVQVGAEPMPRQAECHLTAVAALPRVARRLPVESMAEVAPSPQQAERAATLTPLNRRLVPAVTAARPDKVRACRGHARNLEPAGVRSRTAAGAPFNAHRARILVKSTLRWLLRGERAARASPAQRLNIRRSRAVLAATRMNAMRPASSPPVPRISARMQSA